MHGPVFGAEDEQRDVAQQQHEPESAQELGDHGAAQDVGHETPVAGNAQQKSHQGGQGQGQQRVDAQQLGGQKRGVHAVHQKLAVGEVDDVHHAEDDRKPQRHQREHHPEKQPGNDRTGQNFHAHSLG